MLYIYLMKKEQYGIDLLIEMTMFAFYGASMCYIIDTIIRYFESNIEMYEEQDYED